MDTSIARYYESYDEDGRLFHDNAHKAEYLTTIRWLDRVLAPGSRVLDACVGTGRYAFWLAERGHIVTACDLVEHNVDIIRSKPGAEKLAGIGVCDARDLSRFEPGQLRRRAVHGRAVPPAVGRRAHAGDPGVRAGV